MKSKLQDILDKPAGKVIAVDLDGTICRGEFWGDGEPEPKPEMVAKMWEWYKKGASVIIYTARQPKYYATTLGWLLKNQVPFHGIAMMMKPGADVYIDDKALNIDDLFLDFDTVKKGSIFDKAIREEMLKNGVIRIVGHLDQQMTPMSEAKVEKLKVGDLCPKCRIAKLSEWQTGFSSQDQKTWKTILACSAIPKGDCNFSQ